MLTAFDILFGAFLGISMAAPPGPVMAMMFARSKVSVKSGFLVAMGAMTADITLMLIVLFFRSVIDLKKFESPIFLLGGLYFVYLGFKMLRVLNKGGSLMEDSSVEVKGNYYKGLSTGLVNPMQISWWLTAGLSVMEGFGVSPFYFFYAGIVIYTYSICYIINRSFLKFGQKFSLVIDTMSTIILLGFGIYFIFQFAIITG
ncbi:LysE family translocator [Cuniculiplasma sp. SKW3]|uniref:LysE family translocator n=1 Tax=Cuniculiplasma sp. SKW3 TaxID=3400170 RepID=UPI003FD06719